MDSVAKIMFCGLVLAISGALGQKTDFGDDLDKELMPYEEYEIYLRALLSKYYRLTPPRNMTVTLDLNIMKVVDASFRRGVVTIHGWLFESWNDEGLYANLSETEAQFSRMIIPANNIFLPDIVIYNGLSRPTAKISTVSINLASGNVYRVVPYRWETYCDMSHHLAENIVCKLKFGSWAYGSSQIALETTHSSITVFDDYNDSGSVCKITKSRAEKTSTVYSCCPEPYDDVTFYLTMTCAGGTPNMPSGRTSQLTSDKLSEDETSFKIFPSLPASAATLLSPFLVLVVFLLPPTSGERIIFSAVVFASLLIQLNGEDLGDEQDKFLRFGTLLCVAATFFAMLPIIMLPSNRGDVHYDDTGKGQRKFRLARLIDFGLFAIFAVILVIGAWASLA